MIRFDGQVSIVTGAGAASGLGRAYALFLAARGAKVVVNDLGVGPDGRGIVPVHADRVVEEIVASGGEAIADGHSVTDPPSAEAIVQAALDAWGRVDILINNAGVNLSAPFADITLKDIQRTVDVHLMGTIWMCRAVWPHMQSRGYGRIVNISSGTALGMRYLAVYGAAKAGIMGLTRSLAIEGAEHGIGVNSLAPSAGTGSALYISQLSAEYERHLLSRRPEQVAPTAAFLAHESCGVSGRHFAAAGDGVKELFFAETLGYSKENLQLEDVHDAFDIILDRSNSRPVGDPIELDRTRAFTPKPYVPRIEE
jgi:NAD(P)-dependent dehydrogenase (short-subunit alcohol dehydrogenase family)